MPSLTIRRAVREVRASVGVLTALPVAVLPVRRGSVLALAPLVGALLGGVAAATLRGAHWLFPGPIGAVLAAVVTVAVLAVLTRGLHLDGVADTADGFGRFGDSDAALAVMRKPDLGPFGATALVLLLLADCAALAHATVAGRGPASIAVAVVCGRLAMTQTGVRGTPAARSDGLGASVAESLSRRAVRALTALVVVTTLLASLVLGGRVAATRFTAALVVGVGAAAVLRRCAVARFGGITGDVLGAVCETATSAALLVCAVR